MTVEIPPHNRYNPDRRDRPDLFELGLELNKQIGNLRLEFVKRLYDGRPIAELYRIGLTGIHLHVAPKLIGQERLFHICCRLRSKTQLKDDLTVKLNESEFPMLVWIRQVSEDARPFTTFVQLQALNVCDMRGVESLEPPFLNGQREAILGVINRKLRAILNLTRVENGERIDEIVETGAEIVNGFPTKNASEWRNWRGKCEDWLSGVRIVLDRSIIRVVVSAETIDQEFKFLQVFPCPLYSEIGVIERLAHEIRLQKDKQNVDCFSLT